MKLLIDTNVILDVLCNREEFVDDSSLIMKHCELGDIEGYVSALSFPNIIYILRKELTPDACREIIEKLSLIFYTEDLKADDIKKAARLDFSDYEDALQSVCATRIKAQYIVTRNKKDFRNSKVPAISPSELLEMLYS